MDELSWRARLAKSNINILDIHDNIVFLEFTYHPKAGTFKWCKTMFLIRCNTYPEMAEHILENVLELRKELEG